MKILVLNGPNLNLLGKREPEIYGYETLDDIAKSLDNIANQHEISLFHDQKNSESDLISSIHKAQKAQWHKQLQHELVNQNKVAEGHAALIHRNRRHAKHQGLARGNNQCLPAV